MCSELETIHWAGEDVLLEMLENQKGGDKNAMWISEKGQQDRNVI